jgi:hypothetical protein
MAVWILIADDVNVVTLKVLAFVGFGAVGGKQVERMRGVYSLTGDLQYKPEVGVVEAMAHDDQIKHLHNLAKLISEILPSGAALEFVIVSRCDYRIVWIVQIPM